MHHSLASGCIAISLFLFTSSSASAQNIPFILKDINGGGGSFPNHITQINGVTYFWADDGVHDHELWKTDGTPEGTVMVKDICPPEFTPSLGSPFVELQGKAYFGACDGVHGGELWKTNGTQTGTFMVGDTCPGMCGMVEEDACDLPPDMLTVIGNQLYFRAHTGQFELWKSNGTLNGTVMVRDINPFGSSYPAGITDIFGVAYMWADDGAHGRELWRSNGSWHGTTMIEDIVEGPAPSSILGGDSTFVKYLWNVFFIASDGAAGAELWSTDGTVQGTTMIKDINLSDGSNPHSLTNIISKIYFGATESGTDEELWWSDGSEEGTVRVKDINAGPEGSFPRDLIARHDFLYFSADDGVNGRELWRSDGTDAGTWMVLDINPTGDGILDTGRIGVVGDKLYFWADDGVHGIELWESDGTACNTRIVADINPAGNAVEPNSPLTYSWAFQDPYLLFRATDGVSGDELFALDLGSPLGIPYCISNTNSVSPTGANIYAHGTSSITENDLFLRAGPIPVGKYGVYYHGPQRTVSGQGFPFGSGRQCVIGVLNRMTPPTISDSCGYFRKWVDNSQSATVGIFAGSTQHFQGWYRDPDGPEFVGASHAFNTSNAITIMFTP